MAEKKINRRVQYTISALKNALIDLVAEKPLQSITVTDICVRADINRSTFYLHYKDARALLSEVEDDIFSEIKSILSIDRKDTLVFLMRKVKNNRRMIQLMRALIGEDGDPQFVRQLQKQTYQFFQKKWDARLPFADVKYKKLVYTYTVAGMTAAIASWIEDSSPELEAEDVVETLYAFMNNGIFSLVPVSENYNDIVGEV